MSRGAQVRDTIELLCRILKENGMSFIEAETLRKAKFDKPEATAPLWRLLFELIFFCQHGLMGSGVFTSFIKMSAEDQVRYVKKEMQKRGYLSRSFAALSPAMTAGSRELLLALAWLINKESVIAKFMDHRSSPIHDDVLSLYESVESEEGWSAPSFGDKKTSAAQRVQQMLALNNKLTMNLRLLHASQQHFAALSHKIHNSTYGVSLSPHLNHLSSMQTYMLRHPQHMNKVLTLLEEDSCRLDNLLQWQDRDPVFWDWMESVLELKIQQMTSNPNAATSSDLDSDSGDECTVFLDVPPTIGADIATSRRQLMNKILHYETTLNTLEELWATKRVTVPEWELDQLLHEVNQEITELQTRLGQAPQCNAASTSSCAAHPRLMFVKNPVGARAPGKISNTVVASSRGTQCQDDEATCIQEEISQLQGEADKLERELLALRRHCLQKLNTMIAAVPDAVCILPPQLRSLAS